MQLKRLYYKGDRLSDELPDDRRKTYPSQLSMPFAKNLLELGPRQKVVRDDISMVFT